MPLLQCIYYLYNYIKKNFMFYLIRMNENVREKIKRLYPDTFEMLTYQNYKAKFHSLLFIEEIEVIIFYTLNTFILLKF